ncbi:MAG: hypothetical protein VX951_09995 [Planctomycetota bacterium]|nr:hypothetical protein [Planctomycetota bacterium]
MARFPITVSALLWSLAAGLMAQESTSSAAITAGGRRMSQALDSVLGGAGRDAPGLRTLIFLIDPSPAVKQANFVGELRNALKRNRDRLVQTKIGIAGVGVRGVVVLKPSSHQPAIVAAAKLLLVKPSDKIRNVYKDIRALATAYGPGAGDRELILVSLENGDAEDSVETTGLVLRRANIVFRCIASESYLADSYWSARPYHRAPSKCTLTGGDGAFVDLPWGWLMQGTVANEVAPSSFAPYPLSRLAAMTKGRAHIFSPSASRHSCAVHGSCLFCNNDHSPNGDRYWRARMSRFAPSTESRRQVFAAAADDAAFRAMLRAWQKASRAGLLRSSPSVKVAGNGLSRQRPRVGRIPMLFLNTGFPRHAAKSLKLAKECDKIRAALLKDLASVPRSKGVPRYRAMAEFTAVMLQLTKVNLVTYAGWCREIAPGLVAKNPPEYQLPEIDSIDRLRRSAGVSYSNYSLCHGVRPFFDVELPGGAALRKELEILDSAVSAFENFYGHTPIAAGLHRSGIAHFRITYHGLASKGPRKRPRSSQTADPVTERGRPSRPGRSSSATSGATTGK